MDDLIIEDNYNKWIKKIDNLPEKELVSLNWKNIFQRFKNILSSRLPDFEIRINIFNFLLKIITKNLVTTDTEIKSYFNNIIPIIITYTTNPNVNNILIFLDNSSKICNSSNEIFN